MFMPALPLFPVGGPHLFSACVFVLPLKSKRQLFPSNKKPSVASRVWAQFFFFKPLSDASANQAPFFF